MHPHGKSSKVRPSRTNHRPSPQLLGPAAVAEVKALTCSGCGKPGVSICARCSKKPRYKAALARVHPLQERDPELYSDEQTRKHWSPEEWYRSMGIEPRPRPT